MAFGIPNEVDAFEGSQSELDAKDLEIIAAAVQGNGVLAGCAVTTAGTDMNVDVAAGTVHINGAVVAVAPGALLLTQGGANPKFYLITVNNSGTKAATAGAVAAEPIFPNIPANSVVLAAVYVPASDTIITSTQIVDKRMFVPALSTQITATRQVETAIVVGTITTAGNAKLTVKATEMSNSPKDVIFAVALDDTASEVATKARTALDADADVSAFFEAAGGAGANIVLTKTEAAINDVSLNIAIDNDTCAGLTPDATSNNTTAGANTAAARFNKPMTFQDDTPDPSAIFEISQPHRVPNSDVFNRGIRVNAVYDPGATEDNLIFESGDYGGGIRVYNGSSGHQIRAGVFETTAISLVTSGQTGTVAEVEFIRITMSFSVLTGGATMTLADVWGIRIRHGGAVIGTLNVTTMRGIEVRNPHVGTHQDYYGIHVFDHTSPTGFNRLLEIGGLRSTASDSTTSAPVYLRITGNQSDVDRETAVWISEGSGAGYNLRQLKTKAGDTLGAGDRACVLV